MLNSAAACLDPGLFSLALLVLISHLGGPNPRRLAFNRHDQAHQVMGSPDLYISSSLNVEPDPEVVVQLLETLVTVPDDEVGEIAICASLRNEGRFIVEWLLYVSCSRFVRLGLGAAYGCSVERGPERLTTSPAPQCYQYRVLGVDRFYL